MEKIRVLLVSNFTLLRAGLRSLLGNCDQLDVIGESTLETVSVEFVQQTGAQVVIVETGRDEEHACEVVRALAAQFPVIALSTNPAADLVLCLLRAGVKGYLSHQEAADELVRAVQAVAQGEVFLCTSASKTLLTGYRQRTHPQAET
ncbi:MAG: response regulator transcription factor [Anaerolineae bacterium]